MKIVLLILISTLLMGCSALGLNDDREPRIIYVDSSSDAKAIYGTIEEPLKSLEQLNRMEMVPGDQILV